MKPKKTKSLTPSQFHILSCLSFTLILLCCFNQVRSQGTRLLRQPSIGDTQIAYTYGGDIWVSNLNDTTALRITSTPAVEEDPHISPDGKCIAFTSNRSGTECVYVVSIKGGTPKRLTWHPNPSYARGWTVDSKRILYASSRDVAPGSYNRLWTISLDGGPGKMLSAQWGFDGAFSPDGNKIVIDRVSRWDSEWREYRGGQNTPLTILNLNDLSETHIPNQRTKDILPVWIGDKIYFLSDRDWTMNVWAYTPSDGNLKQITKFTGSDVKWLDGKKMLTFEREGYLYTLDPQSDSIKQLSFTLFGDFPWSETKWEDVTKDIQSAALSPSGKRAIMESRGEIFTIPVEHGDVRNMTHSSGVADRAPIWSPKGTQIAWFSDEDKKNYTLKIADQDGLSPARTISIGESKLAWEPVWSPDGKFIAFADDDLRVRVIDLANNSIKTIGQGGINIERGYMGLTWSPDSKWLAYSRSGSNFFRRIIVWHLTDNSSSEITNSFADAFSPAWDKDGKHLYFLASTDVALGSGWANTSSMTSRPEYAAYIINLRDDDPSPFKLRSDEEPVDKEPEHEDNDKKKDKNNKDKKDSPADSTKVVKIDFDKIERNTLPLPLPLRNYQFILAGMEGQVFISEQVPNNEGLTLQKFTLKERKTSEFINGVRHVSFSTDGKKILVMEHGDWKIINSGSPKADDIKPVQVNLTMNLDRTDEWRQMFDEAWRYEHDYFYDPNMHGRDWNDVYKRYAPLVPYIKHRTDLTYILDQVNGELSVGHSFVNGGDYPDVEKPVGGLLGADLAPENNRWRIKRIYTTESWNPDLNSPLDQPGSTIHEGEYLVGINGKELTAGDNPFQFLDGTANHQTVLQINKDPEFDASREEIIKPISSEYGLRTRAWVEDNRRLVDSLSHGQLAYVWIPNTAGQGLTSFNRYFFAQQDKKGAVIDERFNGGGLLDDYMVDLMTRKLRAAYTNEVPDGKPGVLPSGILGPKVLLINEMSGSGGDFFPWVFRHQKAGPLIGARTWGGLVKSSVHYPLVDGGTLTAPDNAIFDPAANEWIAENKGVPPDIEVHQDALNLSKGKDPQLERAVKEALSLLETEPLEIKHPPYSTPAIKKD